MHKLYFLQLVARSFSRYIYVRFLPDPRFILDLTGEVISVIFCGYFKA